MTSVRRQIYLSKVAVDRWVVICGSSFGVRRKEGGEWGGEVASSNAGHYFGSAECF